ncbi:RNA polymerase sigma factor [Paenibacillus sp. TC-CSREp1]|uniref:RNA polymerase sigma factor n=1 Tax=Paenibacillus sp. TC-CSREp1 TaxID=3410089 RepID=UPI003CF62336
MIEKKWFYLLCIPYDELEKDQQEIIYKKYRIFVYSDLYTLLYDHALTEDLIHESFLKIISRAPHLQSVRNIPAWVRRVACTTAIDYIRKVNKETKALHALAPLYETPNSFSVETILEKKWVHEELYDAIGELHNDQRRMVEMFYLDRKSCKEIGAIVRLSEAATSKRLERARKQLRKLIKF